MKNSRKQQYYQLQVFVDPFIGKRWGTTTDFVYPAQIQRLIRESGLAPKIDPKSIQVLSILPLNPKAYNPAKKQYDAGKLLQQLETFQLKNRNHSQQKNKQLYMYIVSQDIYYQHYQFVFGIAKPGLGTVVSTSRLIGCPEFLLKEITHELGHCVGLLHCQLPCVMTYSNTVGDALKKTRQFCDRCLWILSQQ